MDNIKLREGLDSLNRVKLLMGYDMSKTLKENTLVLEQEPESRFETKQTKDIVKTGEQDRIETKKQQKENEIQNTYPNFCSYPNKTNSLPKICSQLKQNNELSELAQFCYYSSPAIVLGEKVNGIFIPKDATINFWTIESIYSFYEQVLKKYKNIYKTNNEKKELLNLLSSIIPVDTVQSFVYNKVEYHSNFRGNLPLYEWKFTGYKNGNNEYYITPVCIDNREEYQKIMDDWLVVAQWGAVIATIILGAVTEGAGWVYTAEILADMGVGSLIAFREFQKGENVSAVLSILFGMLPLLRISKTMRGVNNKAWREISEKLKTTKLENQGDYVNFYDDLSEEAKLGWNQIVRRDEISRNQMFNEINKELKDFLPKKVWGEAKLFFANNPDKIKKINFIKRFWVKEAAVGAGIGLSGLIANVFFDNILNNEDRDNLDGIMFSLPDNLKLELAVNLVSNNPEVTKKFVSEYGKKLRTGLEKIHNDYQKNTLIKDSIKKSGGVYTEIPEDDTTSIKNETLSDIEIEKIKKEGWNEISVDDTTNYPDNQLRFINGWFWVQSKNKE